MKRLAHNSYAVGERVGSFVIIQHLGTIKGSTHLLYQIKCVHCGRIIIRESKYISALKSCGCLLTEGGFKSGDVVYGFTIINKLGSFKGSCIYDIRCNTCGKIEIRWSKQLARPSCGCLRKAEPKLIKSNGRSNRFFKSKETIKKYLFERIK